MFKHPNAGRIASDGTPPAKEEHRYHGRRAIPQLGGPWGGAPGDGVFFNHCDPKRTTFNEMFDQINYMYDNTRYLDICVLLSPRHAP